MEKVNTDKLDKGERARIFLITPFCRARYLPKLFCSFCISMIIIIYLFLTKTEITFLFSLSSVSRSLTDWKLQTPRWPSEPARSCTSSTTSRWCPASASSSASSSTSSFLRSFYVFLRSCGHNAWTAKLQVGRFYSLSVGSSFLILFGFEMDHIFRSWVIYEGCFIFPFRWTRRVPNKHLFFI